MEMISTYEGETTTYNREAVFKEAVEEVLTLLGDKFPELKTTEKISVLRELINELAVTIEGTNIPLDNGHRHKVEALARLLRVEETRLKLELVIARHPELV